MSSGRSDVFVIRRPESLRALHQWLSGRNYNLCLWPLVDQRGVPFIGLKLQHGEDNRKAARRGIVIVHDVGSAPEALRIIAARANNGAASLVEVEKEAADG